METLNSIGAVLFSLGAIVLLASSIFFMIKVIILLIREGEIRLVLFICSGFLMLFGALLMILK